MFIEFVAKMHSKIPYIVTGSEHLDEDIWEIMPPADFFEFVIPFEMHGATEV